MELSQSGKCMCLGRIFYDAPNPAQATKRFIQPGYARVPKPISANALNYVVFEWFPCVTPEMDVISGEILMEYICDQCKLAIAMYVIHQISICFVHSFFFFFCQGLIMDSIHGQAGTPIQQRFFHNQSGNGE